MNVINASVTFVVELFVGVTISAPAVVEAGFFSSFKEINCFPRIKDEFKDFSTTLYSTANDFLYFFFSQTNRSPSLFPFFRCSEHHPSC